MFDLSRIGAVTAAMLGDVALDIYWYADMKKSELSRETPHFPLPVVREVTSPGAGGNVAANLAALRPRRVLLCGVLGDDWRGALLRQRLAAPIVDTDGLIVEQGRFTQAYCKPMRMGISDVVYEDPRLDFAADAPIAPATEAAVLAWLDRAEREADVLCVCDQFANGIVTEAVLARLGRMRIPVAVDSRARIERFRVRGVLKPNEFECRAALARLGLPLPGTDEAAARAGRRDRRRRLSDGGQPRQRLCFAGRRGGRHAGRARRRADRHRRRGRHLLRRLRGLPRRRRLARRGGRNRRARLRRHRAEDRHDRHGDAGGNPVTYRIERRTSPWLTP